MASYDDTATVSGSVVSIENGADEVGAKSCVVTVRPTLSGVSAVTETQTGRNLLLLTDGTYTIGITGANATILNGEISVTGTTVNSGGRTTRLSDYFVLHAGTYYISPVISTSPYVRSYLNKKSDNTVVGYSKGSAFTVSEDTEVYFGINIESGKTYNITLTPQLEFGSTAHAYEPYTAPTTYTASLGRTIYGGTADIVNGTAEPTNYLDTANAETKSNNSVSVTCDGKGKYTATGTATGGSANITFTLKTPCTIQNGMYLHLMNSGANASVSITLQKQDNTSIMYYSLSPANRIVDLSSYVGQTIYSLRFYVSNGASFEMTLTPTLCYSSAVTPYSPYFTPFTFDGQEIPTRLGYNAFWSEQGNSEVTYYKDGYGFTSVTVNKTGRNLFNEDWEIGGINDTTGVPNSDTNKIRSKTFSQIKGGTTCYVGAPQNIRVLFYTSSETFISETANIKNASFSVPSNCALFKIRGTVDYGTTYNNDIIICYGSTAHAYEPYEAVTKTAKLHKVIYGGIADVIRGTCEPKNLIYPKYEGRTNAGITYTVNSDHSITCQGVASATSLAATNLSGTPEKMQLFPAGKYTVSGGVSSNVRVYCGGIYTDGTTPYLPHDTGSGATITLEKPAYLYPQIRIESGTDLTTPVTIYIQLEAGSSVSDYAPHFEPFTFPPISMETDEGENTLFANEGTSAITYRKAVD